MMAYLLVDSDAPGCAEGTVALRLSAFAAPLGANRANDAGDEGGRGGKLLFFELGSFERFFDLLASSVFKRTLKDTRWDIWTLHAFMSVRMRWSC